MAEKDILLRQDGDILYPVTKGSNVVYGATDSGITLEEKVDSKQDALVSGTNIKTINNTSLLGSGNIAISGGDSLPDQTGNAGKFLTTDGTDASWATVSVPTGVYTKTNLLSGNNISIARKPSSVVGNETVFLCHFNNSSVNEVENAEWSWSMEPSSYSSTNPVSESLGNFCVSSNCMLSRSTNLTQNDSFTVEAWVRFTTAYVGSNFGFSSIASFGCSGGNISVILDNNTIETVPYTAGDWIHLAITHDADSHIFYYYANGIKVGEGSINSFYLGTVTCEFISSIDELRITNNALYLSSFTPFTVPYTIGYPLEEYQINSTLKAGTNVSIAADGTISATDTTYSAFTGADGTADGAVGLVPAPTATDNTKYLKGDGTWATVATGDPLPSQTGNSGKFLTTNGTAASWATVSVAPTLTWYTSADWTLAADNKTLTVSDTTSANLVKVYKNGLLLQPTEDYTLSGTSLVFVAALDATDKITLEVY